jgi:hypothetical protein
MSQFLTHKSVFKLAGCAEQKKQESPPSNVKRSTKAFFFSFNSYRGPSLPYKLDPWDKATFV